MSFIIEINTLRPRQNGRHFADDIFKRIFLNENVWIPNRISLKLVPSGQTNNIPALVQTMAWRRPGDKPLSGPMMVILLTHICVTRPQRVNKGMLVKCHCCEAHSKESQITYLRKIPRYHKTRICVEKEILSLCEKSIVHLVQIQIQKFWLIFKIQRFGTKGTEIVVGKLLHKLSKCDLMIDPL